MKKIPLLLLTVLLTFANYSAVRGQGVSLDWAKDISGPGHDWGNGIAVDPSGNVYTAGYFADSADFDPNAGVQTLVSKGGAYDRNIFISKLDAAGNYVWAKQIGRAGYTEAHAIATDIKGNVYVTGIFGDTVDFDPGPGVAQLSGIGGAYGQSIFILKLDADGNFKWAKEIVRSAGFSGIGNGMAIVVDSMGNVYSTGGFQGTTDFDPGAGVSNLVAPAVGFNYTYDIYISKLDSAGNFIWAKQMGGKKDEMAMTIVLDGIGGVYTTGYFNDTADFDPGPGVSNLISFGGQDIFVSKLDTGGNFVWAKQMGGTGYDNGYSLGVDKFGNVYSTGYFSNTADFDPGAGTYPLTAPSVGYNIYVSKLDGSGNFIWAKQMPGAGYSTSYNLGLDASGQNICIAGGFQGRVDFDPSATGTDTLTAQAANDIFVVRLDSAGNLKWVKQMGGPGDEQALSMAYGRYSSDIYLTGYFNGTADFDPGAGVSSLTSGGDADIFVVKLVCSDTSSATINASTCGGDYAFNGQTYTATGTYIQTLPNASGCDSTITLHLAINHIIPAAITVNGFELGTTAPYKTYQWFLNGTLIAGATDSSYTVLVNGAYAVAVTDSNGCTDTSNVYNVTNVGVASLLNIASTIGVYPNPAKNIVYIAAPIAVNITISSVDGKQMVQQNNAKSIDIKSLATGFYMLRITDANGVFIKTQKLIKE